MDDPLDQPIEPKVQRAKINLETARTSWESLQRFFANGSLIIVNPALDLVDVAEAAKDNNAAQIKAWMDQELIAPPTIDQARGWFDLKAELWAVVVKPWVIAQEAVPDK